MMEPMTNTQEVEMKIPSLSITSTSDDHTVTTDFDLESTTDYDNQNVIDNDSGNNVQDDHKKEAEALENKIIVDQFIKNVIASTKDLVFVYVVLKKCFDCGLFTKTRYQNCVLESFAQTSMVIATMESTTGHGLAERENKKRSHEEGIQIEQQKEHFNYLLETCPFISETEYQTFLDQRLKDAEKKALSLIGNENKAEDQTSTTRLKRNKTNEDLCMTECFDTMMAMSRHDSTPTRNVRINAFSSIASLVYDSIRTDCPTVMDSDDHDCLFTDETASTIPSQVCQITDFGNEEQIESVINSVQLGYESIIGTKLSENMEYVDNLELNAVLTDEDITLSMSNFTSVEDEQDDNFHGPMETVMKLKMAMIYVVLAKLDDRYEKEDLQSIVEIMEKHPSIASIQEKGCETSANLILPRKSNCYPELTYEDSLRLTNVLVETMTNHRNILNVQNFGYDVIKRLTALEGIKNNEKRFSNDNENCCMNVFRIFSRRNEETEMGV